MCRDRPEAPPSNKHITTQFTGQKSYLNDNIKRYAFEFVMAWFTTTKMIMVMMMIIIVEIVTKILAIIMKMKTIVLITIIATIATTKMMINKIVMIVLPIKIITIVIMITITIKIAMTIALMTMLMRTGKREKRIITMKSCCFYTCAISHSMKLLTSKTSPSWWWICSIIKGYNMRDNKAL